MAMLVITRWYIDYGYITYINHIVFVDISPIYHLYITYKPYSFLNMAMKNNPFIDDVLITTSV